jgi:hypothetical protein
VNADVTATLDDQALARVDALARQYRITRDEMLARIFQTGLLHEERHARDARAQRDGGAP